MNEFEKLYLEKKFSFWQIVFYISMATVTLWLILKLLGVIKTPLWLEYDVPIGGLIVGALGLYYNILQSINQVVVNMAKLTIRFEHFGKDLHLTKTDVRDLKENVHCLNSDMRLVKKKTGTDF